MMEGSMMDDPGVVGPMGPGGMPLMMPGQGPMMSDQMGPGHPRMMSPQWMQQHQMRPDYPRQQFPHMQAHPQGMYQAGGGLPPQSQRVRMNFGPTGMMHPSGFSGAGGGGMNSGEMMPQYGGVAGHMQQQQQQQQQQVQMMMNQQRRMQMKPQMSAGPSTAQRVMQPGPASAPLDSQQSPLTCSMPSNPGLAMAPTIRAPHSSNLGKRAPSPRRLPNYADTVLMHPQMPVGMQHRNAGLKPGMMGSDMGSYGVMNDQVRMRFPHNPADYGANPMDGMPYPASNPHESLSQFVNNMPQ